MWKLKGRSNERILCKLSKSEGCIQSFMLPWELQKRHILPVDQNLSSVYFSLAKFQLVSCNLSLAMIWQKNIYSQTAKTVLSHLKSNNKLAIHKSVNLRAHSCDF